MDNEEYSSYPVTVSINQPEAGLLKILLICRLHLLPFPLSTIWRHALLFYFTINTRNQQPDQQDICGSPQHWEDERRNVPPLRIPLLCHLHLQPKLCASLRCLDFEINYRCFITIPPPIVTAVLSADLGSVVGPVQTAGPAFQLNRGTCLSAGG